MFWERNRYNCNNIISLLRQFLCSFPDDRSRLCRPQAMTVASRAIAKNAVSQVYRGRPAERKISAPEMMLRPKSCLSRRSHLDSHAEEDTCVAKNTNGRYDKKNLTTT